MNVPINNTKAGMNDIDIRSRQSPDDVSRRIIEATITAVIIPIAIAELIRMIPLPLFDAGTISA